MQCPACQAELADGATFCVRCGTSLSPEQRGPDPLLGTTIGGKYKVVRLLGEGGMGCVYVAEQQLGPKTRNVALKTLHKHLSDDEKIRERFTREVATVAELEHPNTIQVFDFGSTPDGLLYIVMEFIQGKSIADVLEKEGPLDPARVINILKQVGGSLEEAHAHGIVHRDLKPDNVVLTDRAGQKDFVKVLDFGIAKRNEANPNEKKLTQQGMVLGTPQYMAPEQFLGKPIDARADVYSLGVMTYEMLTGQLPFAANTAWEWATQHMTQSPRAIESQPNGTKIPQGLKNAIRRALEKDPAARFPSMKAFIEAATDNSAPQPVQNTPNGNGSVPRQKTQIGEPLPMDAYAQTAQPAIGAPGGMGGANPYAATPQVGGRSTMAADAMPPMVADAYNAPPQQLAPRTPMGAMQPMQPMQPAMPMGPPGGVAPPPPSESSGGGNRGLLLAVAAIVGLLSAASITYAVWPKSSEPVPVDLGGGGGGTTPTSDPTNTNGGGGGGTTPTSTGSGSTPLGGGATPLGGGGGGGGGTVVPVHHPDAGHVTPVPTQPVPTQPVPTQPTPTHPVPTQPVPTQTTTVPVIPIPTFIPTVFPTQPQPIPTPGGKQLTPEQKKACDDAAAARARGIPNPSAEKICRDAQK